MKSKVTHIDITRIFAIMFIILLFLGCNDKKPTDPEIYELELSIKVAKWYDNNSAAISLTYDSGCPQCEGDREVQSQILERNMHMDYELVTYNLNTSYDKMEYIVQTLIPQGFKFFGHGNWHINHDALSFYDALESFSLCYKTMEGIGIKRVAYAYPGGYGYRDSTRIALAEAGFLSGRMHHTAGRRNPYIIPDTLMEPHDWYQLPTLVMQAYEFNNNESAINNTNELIPFLDEAIRKKAWIITSYHSIGSGEGWGFYYLSNFINDLDAIKSRDFWVASMNDITLYILERKDVSVFYEGIYNSSGILNKIDILLSDELPNDLYDQTLTVLFTIPEEWVGGIIEIYQGDDLIDKIIFNYEEVMLSLKPNEQVYSLILI